MTVGENEAVEAFERLGLTSYEAKVFIALHRLEAGTARDVARITDVPRSQVYTVAESLEERGLLEIQQSSPIRYRPVSLEEAQETLQERFERERDRAFEYVDDVKHESAGEETQEDIWTVRGRDRVDDRVVDLLSSGEERIVFGTRLPELVTERIERTLEERAASGATVLAVSRADRVRDRLDSLEGVVIDLPPPSRESDQRSGRIVIADDDAILLSVVDDDGGETAIWSSGSLFASVLVQLIEAGEEVAASSETE
ncbi:TrmB family transcriptional regulator [Natronobacterium gregoryi]|uniref:Transcriptional regulator n=2 Tax=Natronobacterium gregoryi TaxID=44930 RepID=L0AH70_NATGS|nr:helix-turn-helix domain-containing protein [Natronobacterium gregoryi]AFZ73243.1 putative transcriptional regulator [Natronobacterium gregoryi SP2]ELY71298.1 TrmB family transcriptional regulator [Natronobacterium gregoryi SP2]PLK21650.1 TrmB family transcriptional regulator [Natronobacterium gregoryi SP2]SFI57633.1 Sugar-specific transcriptional regulator TrmB [Natronobacterium gregoryi]